MTTQRLSPARALAQCVAGGAGVIGLVALLWWGLPWTAIGHVLEVVLTAVGHALWWVLGPVCHALGWVLSHVWRGVAMAFSWIVLSPLSFGVLMTLALLTLLCLLYKLDDDQLDLTHSQQKTWNRRATTALVLLLVYAWVSAMGAIGAFTDDSEGNYVRDKTLYRQLDAMDDADGAATFAEQVALANRLLDRYNYQTQDGKTVVVEPRIRVVDATARVAAFTATELNHRTCLHLRDASSALVAQEINGHPIRTAADLTGACAYAWHNAGVLYNQPHHWAAPESTSQTVILNNDLQQRALAQAALLRAKTAAAAAHH